GGRTRPHPPLPRRGGAWRALPPHPPPPYRGADAAAQGELHDRHRHPQHAAGHARGRHDGVLLGRDVAERTNGISRGDGADEGNLRESTAEAHQGLHLGALQLTRLVSIAAATVLGLIVTAPTPGGGQARSAGALTLQGAGATFPAPLYHRWISVYTAEHPEAAIDYKDVGSGEGVNRFVGASVDFAASDGAMSDEQMASVNAGVRLVPATAGMVVLAYNLPGLGGELKLSRDVYLDIFDGTIVKWNDPRIRAVNPGLRLPNWSIVIVARQASSGTAFGLTNHRSTIGGPGRNIGPGVGYLVAWSRRATLARGKEGVAARVKISEGSIGYVEYGFARRLGLPMALLQNRIGRYVAP